MSELDPDDEFPSCCRSASIYVITNSPYQDYTYADTSPTYGMRGMEDTINMKHFCSGIIRPH